MKGKKILAGVISATMVLSTMAVPVFADDPANSTSSVNTQNQQMTLMSFETCANWTKKDGRGPADAIEFTLNNIGMINSSIVVELYSHGKLVSTTACTNSNIIGIESESLTGTIVYNGPADFSSSWSTTVNSTWTTDIPDTMKVTIDNGTAFEFNTNKATVYHCDDYTSFKNLATAVSTDGEFKIAVEDNKENIILTDNVAYYTPMTRNLAQNSTIDLNGKTLTLSGYHYDFCDTTIKNGNILVTTGEGNNANGIFSLYSPKTLTFDNVKLKAENLGGPYLMSSNDGAGKFILTNGTVFDVTASETGGKFYGLLSMGSLEVLNGSKITFVGPQRGTINANVKVGENSTLDFTTALESLHFNANNTYSVDETANVKATTNKAVDSSVALVTTKDDDDEDMYVYYNSIAEAFEAVQNGETVTIIGTVDATTTDFEKAAGKTFTIEGPDDNAALNLDWAQNATAGMNNANINFKNIIMNWSNNIYKGLAHSGNLSYENCTINGLAFLYGTTETFKECTFNQEEVEYNVWTYGAGTATFTDCTFNSNGKSVLVYKENGTVPTNVNVKGCTFVAANAVPGKAAIEVDTSLNPANISIENSTATGFGVGSYSGSTLWNVKKTNTSAEDGGVEIKIDNNAVTFDPVSINFVKNTDESNGYKHVYDVTVSSVNGIKELNSVDLTFAFTSEQGKKVKYEVAAANDMYATPNGADRYIFNYNDGADRKSGTDIVIAKVTVSGFGGYTLGCAEADTNVVHATSEKNNIVNSFVPNSDGKNTGRLVYGEVQNDEITQPTHKLTVNVTFPKAINANAADYQNMTVTIKGADKEIVTALGNGAEWKDDGYYAVEAELTENNAYTVTVEGAGYRTARHTVTMTADKKLNFWNNVMDENTAIEQGGTADRKVSFLAGEMVDDGEINIYDLSAVVSYFGQEAENTTSAWNYVKYDLDRNGIIDSHDVAYILTAWLN